MGIPNVRYLITQTSDGAFTLTLTHAGQPACSIEGLVSSETAGLIAAGLIVQLANSVVDRQSKQEQAGLDLLARLVVPTGKGPS
jgi:hypothetical protein